MTFVDALATLVLLAILAWVRSKVLWSHRPKRLCVICLEVRQPSRDKLGLYTCSKCGQWQTVQLSSRTAANYFARVKT